MDESWITTAEAAEYLGVHQNTLYRLVKENKVPYGKIGKSLRFKKSQMDEFMKKDDKEVDRDE